MRDFLVFAVLMLALGGVEWLWSLTYPTCKWCRSRHYGRCVYNPRAGFFWANPNDGYFDYHDQNK